MQIESANHAQTCANQAIAEATLLAMRCAHASGWDGQDGELEAGHSNAHGVAEVTRALDVSHGGTKEEPGRHQAHGKAGDQGGGSGVTVAIRGETAR